MKKLIMKFLLLMIFALAVNNEAATHAASSAAYADVETALGLCVSGDTLTIPGDTATWSSGLNITTDGLTILGAGVGQTIITSSGGSYIMSYTVQNPALELPVRISGFTLNGNGKSTDGIDIWNNSNTDIYTNLEIDHCKLYACNSTNATIAINGKIYGVINNDSILSSINNCILVNGQENYSWSDPLDISGSDYLFIENCFLSDHTTTDGTITLAHGGRAVIRNNTFAYRPRINIHGNGSSSVTYSGVHSGPSGASFLTDGTKNWTTNTLASGYYVLVNHSDISTAIITANSATTATGTLGGGTRNNWNSGDAYTISPWNNPHGAVSCQLYNNTMFDTAAVNMLDARSGTTLAYNNTVYSTLGIGNCTSKIREEDANGLIGAEYPIKRTYPGFDPNKDSYFWNNRFISGGTTVAFPFYADSGSQAETFLINEKVDYWTDIHNWTVPTGYFTFGAYANRPNSPADQQCYWASDSLKLYRSIGANNWTFIYQPYLYPYPSNDSAATLTASYPDTTLHRGQAATITPTTTGHYTTITKVHPLPSWASLNTSTGVISGTPSAKQTKTSYLIAIQP